VSAITRCMIIAEVAQAHDGSLGMAHAYIDAAASAGVDAVKFQTHIAEAESSPEEPWRTVFSLQDATRYDYWKRMEFTEEGWQGLKRHAVERGLAFISSPFSIEAVELLERVGVACWKIASGEVSNPLLLERVLVTGLPVILSTGMSSLAELDEAVSAITARGNELTLLQCTSAYPVPPERVGLNLLQVFRDRYGCKVGLSDHSGTVFPGLAAATLGIDALEVHIVFHRMMSGPDVAASLTVEELSQLVRGIRTIETMMSHPVDKNAVAEEMLPMRAAFTKSIVVRSNLPAKTVLRPEHLTTRKPGTGIPASQLPAIVGRQLARTVSANTFLQMSDLAEDG